MAIAQAADPGALTADTPAVRRRRRRRVSWPLVIGLALLAVIAFCCLAAPLLDSQDPTAQNLLLPGAAPFTPGHLLGTDAPYGRDMLSRILYGGRFDLLIGFGATGVTLVCGTLVGLLAGYVGGRVDTVIMRIVDIVFAFPFVVLILAIVAVLGTGLLSLLVAIWMVGWVAYARIIRGEALVARQQEYVLAGKALGYSDVRLMLRHILPNVVSAAIVFSMADAVANIILGASVSYLGLGVPEPNPEWGRMIADGQLYLSTYWWLAILPGVAILLTGTALSLIGDGLADVLRPRG